MKTLLALLITLCMSAPALADTNPNAEFAAVSIAFLKTKASQGPECQAMMEAFSNLTTNQPIFTEVIVLRASQCLRLVRRETSNSGRAVLPYLLYTAACKRTMAQPPIAVEDIATQITARAEIVQACAPKYIDSVVGGK